LFAAGLLAEKGGKGLLAGKTTAAKTVEKDGIQGPVDVEVPERPCA
jgi:hypothetical protein